MFIVTEYAALNRYHCNKDYAKAKLKNKCVSSLKILGRVGTHNFFFFFWKQI